MQLETRAVEAAKDQSLFREVNERLKELNQTFETLTRDSEFVCECADRNCVEHVTMTLPDYEAVREESTHFLVRPGHVYADVERVIGEHEGYVVVEKFGDAGVAAIKLDPRTRSG